MENETKPTSSYQKGLERLMDYKQNFETLIIEYLLSINSKYKSNMFPTPQIAKVILSKLQLKKSKFPIIHKVVRMILKDWEEAGWCEYLTTTKSSRSRKNKFIYRFSPEQISMLKAKFIRHSMEEIEKEFDFTQIDNDVGEIKIEPAMKSREIIVDDWGFKVQDIIDRMEVPNDENDEEDMNLQDNI